ncbi:MAG: Arc family DNA-binding protein [Burkholderiales bacterium]|nr:Arc family DNA-binding protein [Burkholderiales bacterium]
MTFTVKAVPDRLARRLRERAAAHHRSLQGELMAILEAAAGAETPAVREPAPPPYPAERGRRAPRRAEPAAHGRKLTLAELWERSRRLGPGSASESSAIVRRLRDERFGR